VRVAEDVQRSSQQSGDLGARLVVIDPVVAHLPMKIDSHKDQGVRLALGLLSKLAERQDCAVLGIVHLNKTQGLAPLARVGGSGAFGNAARSVLLLDRDPDDPDGEMGARRVLAHIKCNVGPTAGSLLHRVEPLLLPAVDGQPEVSTSRLELLGESSHSGSALLAGVVSEEERSEFEEACEFLRAELGDGQRHLAVELYREAGKLGISDRGCAGRGKRSGRRRKRPASAGAGSGGFLKERKVLAMQVDAGPLRHFATSPLAYLPKGSKGRRGHISDDDLFARGCDAMAFPFVVGQLRSCSFQIGAGPLVFGERRRADLGDQETALHAEFPAVELAPHGRGVARTLEELVAVALGEEEEMGIRRPLQCRLTASGRRRVHRSRLRDRGYAFARTLDLGDQRFELGTAPDAVARPTPHCDETRDQREKGDAREKNRESRAKRPRAARGLLWGSSVLPRPAGDYRAGRVLDPRARRLLLHEREPRPEKSRIPRTPAVAIGSVRLGRAMRRRTCLRRRGSGRDDAHEQGDERRRARPMAPCWAGGPQRYRHSGGHLSLQTCCCESFPRLVGDCQPGALRRTACSISSKPYSRIESKAGLKLAGANARSS
jgi:hypothetical protein